MMTVGQLKAILADCPDDYMPMVRVHSEGPVSAGQLEYWATSIRPGDITIEPGTHELRFTITDYNEDW